MATSSNPRKFSEKIALHNQKQAEETAAFEEVMKDLSLTRAARLQLQKSQYLQLGPSRGQYYGGSLPNVNQIGSGSVDLPFQTPFQTSGLDTSRTTRHHGLVDRVCRERGRLGSPHRRPLSVDKHGRQVDSCPYSAVYLSPPSDTSWRRTNSDSALHQSTMAPTPGEPFTTSPDTHQKRVLLLTVPGIEDEADKTLSKQGWDAKKAGSRPKSCEVPGINIFPSADHDSPATLIPATHSTGGSLPDLSNIHFPSPLPTPLDPEEPSFPALSSSTSTGNLAHLGIGGTGQGLGTPSSSPQSRPTGSSLALSGEARHPQSQQVPPTLSALTPITQAPPSGARSAAATVSTWPFHVGSELGSFACEAEAVQTGGLSSHSRGHVKCQAVAMDALCLEQHLPFAFFTQAGSPQPPPQPQPPPPPPVPPPQSPPENSGQPPIGIDVSSAPAVQQYRTSAGSPATQSPTSPVSNQGFSPGSSPQHSSTLGSMFGDAFYEQQMTARQANALSRQLEQFNMVESAISSSSMYSPGATLNYSQAAVMGLQDPQQLGYTPHSSIPNIILTVTGESPPSLSKELTSSLAGVGNISFDSDHQFPLDELKIDPLTLDGLHMLNDPDMVLADAATEDTFRMDRL